MQSALGLIPPESVTADELVASVLGTIDIPSKEGSPTLTIQDAVKLSWNLFEALIAEIYARDSERTILTPRGSDHGCDVVVIKWGPQKQNVLIQCKTSKNDELDSEEGVRAVEGSRPFFEKPLGLTFDKKILLTTAKHFSRRTKRAGHTCSVELHGRMWIAEALKVQEITMKDLLRREGMRTRI